MAAPASRQWKAISIASLSGSLVAQFARLPQLSCIYYGNSLPSSIQNLKELLLKGHHGLKRGATIAQANIPRLLKGLPVLGAAGAALLSQDASAASPLLSEAGDVGESPEEEKQLIAEIESHKAYNKSPAKLDRLRKLMSR